MITQPKFWIGQKVRVRTPEEIGSELWERDYECKCSNGTPGNCYTIEGIDYDSGHYYRLRDANYHLESVLELSPDNVNVYPRIPMYIPLLLPDGNRGSVEYVTIYDSVAHCAVRDDESLLPISLVLSCNNPIL